MKFIQKIAVPCLLLTLLFSFGTITWAKGLLLKQGMQGEEVKQVQTALKKLGYFNEDVTGYYGEVTKEAVEKYQKDRNFSVDGVVGSATWSSLVGQSPAAAANSSVKASEYSAVLKQGMNSAQVKEVQARLKQLGYFNSNTTGYFGQATSNAVEKFQSDSGLNADGVVGESTWNKLFGTTSAPKKAESVSVSRGGGLRDSSVREEIVSYAKSLLGVDYVWGGNTTKGFDCSGYAKYVYSKFGINLDRVAASQAKQGSYVSKQDLRLGDLVFFDTDGGHNYINHVGIYIGNGTFIHCSSAQDEVITSPLNTGFYLGAYMTSRTFID